MISHAFTGASRQLVLVSGVAIAALLVSAGPGAALQPATRTTTARALSHLKGVPLTALAARPSGSSDPLARLRQAVASEDRVVLVVRASHNRTVRSVRAAARAQGGTIRHTLAPLKAVSFTVPAARAETVAAQLRSQAGVASVDVAVRRYAFAAPNDPSFASHQATYLNAVTAPTAWTKQPGSATVKIAIVDTGVDVNHPDLAGKIAGTYNAVDDSIDPTDVTDEIGHGTFVAGVAAAATNNGVGVAGASGASSLLAVKVADSNGDMFTDAEANGIDWAVDHGAKVINISLGSAQSDPTEQAAIEYAQDNGVVVVAAAGNDGAAADGNPVDYPAGYPSVISAGATDAAGHRTSFSEHGSWVTVAAPGLNIYSTAPTVRSSSDIFSTASYASGSGTSFSSPLVAGEVALLIAQSPTADVAALRHAVVASAHGYAGLGLGAGQVDFAAALNHLAPITTPTLTAPVDGDPVSGVVALTATSTAPAVRFRVDGAWLGPPVTVVAGSATSSWTTWGVSNAGHTVEAVDCAVTAECAPTSDSVSVTLVNTDPAVTSPVTDDQLSGAYTATATSPGGGVAFLIDGVRRGFDATAPYSFTSTATALTDGAHTFAVTECATDGIRCDGPTSPAVSFTSKSLHPTFSSVSPAVFSPNGDHRVDTTKATFRLPDAESVVVRVKASSGVVVRTVNLGPLGTGTHSWTWNGSGTGGRQRDGVYTVAVSTTKTVTGVVLHGDVSRTVRVDTVAPVLSSVSGSGATFYPVKDGYHDTFAPAVTLHESGTQTMTVRTKKGALVRTLNVAKKAGRISFSWNGRNQHNKIVAAGTYKWTLTARDAAGNARTTKKYAVHVSAKRLVSHTAVLKLHGSKAYNWGGSPSYCAGVSFTGSDFAPNGVWLENLCDPVADGPAIAASFFHFTVPSAHQYKSVRIDTYGNTVTPPSMVRGALLNSATGDFDLTHGVAMTANHSNSWHNLGSLTGTSHVSGHRVTAVVLVSNDYGAPSDFDVDYIRVQVVYTVLR